MANFRVTARDELIKQFLKENGSSSVRQIHEATAISINSLHNRIKTLVEHRIIYEDRRPRNDSARYYKIPDSEQSGARVRIGEHDVSFNQFIIICSKKLPGIYHDWDKLHLITAALARCVAYQIDDEGIILENELLKILKKLDELIETLQLTHSIAVQIRDNETLWNPKTLKRNVALLTDRRLDKDGYIQAADKINAMIEEARPQLPINAELV